MIRITWDKYEIALLIEYCIKIESGVISPPQAADELSTALRNYAIKRNIQIDEIYRNHNGMMLQMKKMEYFLTRGNKGLPGGSNDFKEVAEMYLNDSASFAALLKDAHTKIRGEKKSEDTSKEARSSASDTQPIGEPTLAELLNVAPEAYDAVLLVDFREFLSVRSGNALARSEYRTFGDILRLTIDEFADIRNLGKKSVDECIPFFREYIKQNPQGLLAEDAKTDFNYKNIRKDIIKKNLLLLLGKETEVSDEPSPDEMHCIDELIHSCDIIGEEMALCILENPMSAYALSRSLKEFSIITENVREYNNLLPKKYRDELSLERIKNYTDAFCLNISESEIILDFFSSEDTFHEFGIRLWQKKNTLSINQYASFDNAIKRFVRWLGADVGETFRDFFETKDRSDKAEDLLRLRAQGLTLEQAGKHYQITRERVRQIEAKITRNFCIYVIRRGIDPITLVYAKNQCNPVLTKEMLLTGVDERYSDLFWFFIQEGKLDNYNYAFEKTYRAVIFKHAFKDSQANALAYIESLPDIVSIEEMDRFVSETIAEKKVHPAILRADIDSVFTKYRTLYSKKKLNKRDITEYLLREKFPKGFFSNDERYFALFCKYVDEIFGAKYNDFSVRGLDGLLFDVGKHLGGGKYIHPSLYDEKQTEGTDSSRTRNSNFARSTSRSLHDRIERSKKYTLDLSCIPNMSFTTPIEVVYFGRTLPDLYAWGDVYAALVTKIYSEFRDLVPVNAPFIPGSPKIDFGSPDTMSSPKYIVNGLYLEISLISSEQLKRVRALLDICNIDYNDIEITYIRDNDIDEDLPEVPVVAVAPSQDAEVPSRPHKTDLELQNEFPQLYLMLDSVSKIYDEPEGLPIAQILSMIGNCEPRDVVEAFLQDVSWATRIAENVYSFAPDAVEYIPLISVASPSKSDQCNEQTKSTSATPQIAFDKERFISVMNSRFRGGITLDSIDLDNFRSVYDEIFDEEISLSERELRAAICSCGISYREKIFPCEAIIDPKTEEKLFHYIDSQFADGRQMLYYAAIFEDLADDFVYCFNLVDAKMLRAFLEVKSPEGKYFFHHDYMSLEQQVEIDHRSEIAEFLLKAGKPVTYDELYDALSHIPQKSIYQEIRIGREFVVNRKGECFHLDLFVLSESEKSALISLLNEMIERNGFAHWSSVVEQMHEKFPAIFDNNPYLSELGIRNALRLILADDFSFSSNIISAYGEKLDLYSVYRRFAASHRTFTEGDVYDLIRQLEDTIRFDAFADCSVRVSKELFVAKDMISFDIVAIDAAIDTYVADGYIPLKEIDSFLLFPSVGYEWNIFLLEHYLIYYSERFTVFNNGRALSSVSGAAVSRSSQFKDFLSVCADYIARSGCALTKEDALKTLVSGGLLTRTTYAGIDNALKVAEKMRTNRN